MSDRVLFGTRNETSGSLCSGFGGFYASVQAATAWDGSTYFNDAPSSSATAAANVYGPGTSHPIGFTRIDLTKQIFRGRNLSFTSGGGAVSYTNYVEDAYNDSSEPVNSFQFSAPSPSPQAWRRTSLNQKSRGTIAVQRERDILLSYESVRYNYPAASATSLDGDMYFTGVIPGYVWNGTTLEPVTVAHFTCGAFAAVYLTVNLNWDQPIFLGSDGETYWPEIKVKFAVEILGCVIGVDYPYIDGIDPSDIPSVLAYLETLPGFSGITEAYNAIGGNPDLFGSPGLATAGFGPEAISLNCAGYVPSCNVKVFGQPVPLFLPPPGENPEATASFGDTPDIERSSYWPYAGTDGNAIYDATSGEPLSGRTPVS